MERRKYQTVDPNSSATDEYQPNNGERISFIEFGGNAIGHIDVKVEILWDSEIMFCTHNDSMQHPEKQIEGDGTKKVIIKLTNETEQSETIGGYWKANIYV